MLSLTFAQKIIAFNKRIEKGIKIPKEFQLLNPFDKPEVRDLTRLFYNKFFSDNKERVYILGINPGRFGAGTTGIPFTDPVNLETCCEIPNTLNKRHELSSIYIYEVIKAFGGVKKFYKNFFITAVCPLGFTQAGKNINYYDNSKLQIAVEPFIIETLREQISFGANKKVALILGEGKNFRYLSELNKTYTFFEKLIPLSHPRFILQYRRKKKDLYLSHYISELRAAISTH